MTRGSVCQEAEVHTVEWTMKMISHTRFPRRNNNNIPSTKAFPRKELLGFVLILLYCYSSTVVSIFTPPHSLYPKHPTYHRHSFPPLALSMGPLHMFLHDPSPSFPCYCPLPFPLITVSLFFMSMSMVIFCLLILLIRFHL